MWMKRFSGKKSIFVLLALVAIAIPLLWFGIFTNGPSRKVGAALRSLHSLAAAEGAPVISTSIRIDSANGIRKEIVGKTVHIDFQAPDRLKISAEFDGNDYRLGRNGDSVWVVVPHKKLAIEGRNDVPRFAADDKSFKPVELPALVSTLKSWQLFLLPALIHASEQEDGSIVCRVGPLMAKRFGIPPNATLTLKLDSRGWPSQLGIAKGNFVLKLEVEKFEIGPDLASSWGIPELPGTESERVALSHLEKFSEVMLGNLSNRIEALPPVTGEKQVIATHGNGRLELHDGTRVLFLTGTPEEMGDQHGTLLKGETSDLVNSIVYGVGVGSSFPKGRWFFGEIEEAVSRFQPFTDSRYFREMDSLAKAAGLHPQEVRLANFFPELFHCTGFSLHGNATVDGRMFHGRVLDYLRGLGLEQNAVVMIIQPDEGNAWVNVGYAGFIGSVTAMNEKHLAIGEMGGRGEGNWDGKPMAQLMREVMEKADTIDEAVAIMKSSPRTCEYYYVISDAKTMRAVGIKATPEIFETVWSGESHPQLIDPVEDTVLMSAGGRYTELVKRVKSKWGKFDSDSARELMTRPVCMTSNIQSVLFAPDTLDFWVANADTDNVASATRYTKYNLAELLKTAQGEQKAIPSPSLSYAKEDKN